MSNAGITREMVERAFREARNGERNAAAATLSHALWPAENRWCGWLHGRELAESAYADLCAGRVAEAIEALETVLYPDGIPPHVAVVERLT